MLETKYILTKNSLESSSNSHKFIFKQNVCFNDGCHLTNQRSGKWQYSLNYSNVNMADLTLLGTNLENKIHVSILIKSLSSQLLIL